MKNAVPRILIAILSAGLLLSQSLVDVSKAEKERREKFKGKNVRVVTNADLRSGGKTPAVVIASTESKTDQASRQAAESGEQEAAPAPERALRQRSGGEGGMPYARQVLPESYLVENPERALNPPDGQYAQISVSGVLDLDISANNGPGPDISIYARQVGAIEGQPGTEEEDGMPVLPPGVLAQALWEGFWYGVLVRGESGDWEAIGQGTGKASPEKFDLGSMASIKSVRIVFQPLISPDLPAKVLRSHAKEYAIGIDAVEALH